MDKQEVYLQRIRTIKPELEVRTVRTTSGQFNDIITVNDELIFRFPRSLHEANLLAYEVAILSKLQHKTTLPIPNPIYVSTNRENVAENFMGYAMIIGEPFLSSVRDTIKDDTLLERLATQVATFMQGLHTLSMKDIDLDVPVADTRNEWMDLYQQFRDMLFHSMRPDARERVAQNFELFLNEPGHFMYTPMLRHGDLGGSNILYDPNTQKITGVIDFSSVAIGDPAIDVAAISTCGDIFFQHVCNAYPGIGAMLERAQFYRSTFALQEALYGLRDNDQEAFESGISEYI